MMRWFKEMLKRIFNYPSTKLYKNSDALVIKCLNNENFPYLVSFPRTGSHWLRNIMELYFKRPTLMRTFYYGYKTNFLLYHTHDINNDYYLGNKSCNMLIYLYRNPIDTVFSILKYHNEDINDTERISFWTKLYAEHINKWCVSNTFSAKILLVNYEKLKAHSCSEFKKITNFFNVDFSEKKLTKTLSKITKEKVKKSTTDKKVVNTSEDYQLLRENFSLNYSEFIWKEFYNASPLSKDLFA